MTVFDEPIALLLAFAAGMYTTVVWFVICEAMRTTKRKDP
jgi:hypothetical protein